MIELKGEIIESMDYSTFLVKMICEVLSLESTEKLSEKDKGDFIDSMKGLYFLSI